MDDTGTTVAAEMIQRRSATAAWGPRRGIRGVSQPPQRLLVPGHGPPRLSAGRGFVLVAGGYPH